MCSQENVLLKQTGTDDSGVPQFAPKIADFGMAVAGDIAHDSVKDAVWVGTYLYMSPEATGLNAEKGYPKGSIVTEPANPLFGASDSFSFGLMFFFMITRDERWYRADGLELPSVINKEGKPEEDMQTIARWYYHGNRPQFADDFPPILRLLIEGCWADKQFDRLCFSEIVALLQDETIGWLHVAEAATPEETYTAWLTRMGVADKKEELHEYDVREGEDPLGKLVEQMTEEAEDFAEMLGDLFTDDSEMQATFTAAVEVLCRASPSNPDASVAEERQHITARQELLAKLPARSLEEQLEQKSAQLAEAEVQLLNSKEEIAQLRAQLQCHSTTRPTRPISMSSSNVASGEQ